MIKLIEPCEAYLASYMEAYDEYKQNNVTTYSFDNPKEEDILEKFDRYRKGVDLPAGYVGSDYYWLVDDEKSFFIGQIALRHNLNDKLRILGGHIGYGVRYGQWNKGYGSLMLKLVLEKAKERGLTKVLCTCNDDNIGSARVMEHNGFILEDKILASVDGEERLIRRYWKTL